MSDRTDEGSAKQDAAQRGRPMRALDELGALGEGMSERGELASLEQLAAFLDQLTHDLNNPLGTFGLELFTLGAVRDRLTEALASSDLAEAARQARTLRAVFANLEGASQTAARLLKAIDARSGAWSRGKRSAAAQER